MARRHDGERVLARVLLEHFPDDAARAVEAAPSEDSAAFLETSRAEHAAEVLRRLTPDTAAAILERLGAESARRVLTGLDPSRAAALLARLDPAVRDERLALLDDRSAAELRALLAYPADRAGHLMEPRVTAFRPDTRAGDAIRTLQGLRRRRIQDVFLVGEEGRLVGCVALQDMVVAPPSERLEALARKPAPCVRATAPREEVVEILERTGAGSLAVVDPEDRLVGVLRQQELIEAAKEDATADLVTMVGASEEEKALSAPFFAVRKRLPWLHINLLTAFLAASVVGLFEDTIARFTALAVLLPVVAGQSGNAGAQALAVTMRSLALREVRVRQWLRVSTKEIAAGALNGTAVAATTALAVYLWSGSPGLASVIGTSMVVSMTAAGFAGSAIPMLLTAIGQDPAQSSSILLTTVTDVVGFLSFLGIAVLLSSAL